MPLGSISSDAEADSVRDAVLAMTAGSTQRCVVVTPLHDGLDDIADKLSKAFTAAGYRAHAVAPKPGPDGERQVAGLREQHEVLVVAAAHGLQLAAGADGAILVLEAGRSRTRRHHRDRTTVCRRRRAGARSPARRTPHPLIVSPPPGAGRLRLSAGHPAARLLRSSLLAQAALVVSGPLVVRMLGISDRGRLALVFAVVLLVSRVGVAGLPAAVTWFVASRRLDAAAFPGAPAATLRAAGRCLRGAGRGHGARAGPALPPVAARRPAGVDRRAGGRRGDGGDDGDGGVAGAAEVRGAGPVAAVARGVLCGRHRAAAAHRRRVGVAVARDQPDRLGGRRGRVAPAGRARRAG
ncbi:hypothetical protein [Nocardioides sp. B-3]|uniref:hypothetical protein n=1 Tax=Nocardioides sp. B-3 TaxID=2895565 RepID=UPI002152AAD7|nr:hypothetical protein [Nocardioides sp. B-3]UUZ57630.1 hypothetical protein LP418_14300 [Nocardioides sp. B-3]